jgi:hypothetical protein
MQGFRKRRMIFREFEEDSDTDSDEDQPKKIKYSKFLQEEEFIDDDEVSPFS